MTILYKEPKSGFTLIITSLIISLFLLNLAITTNLKIFWLRTNLSYAEFKNTSVHLAEACADLAILRIIKDSNYTGNEVISIGNEICKIKNTTYKDLGNNSKEAVFITKSNYQNAFSNLEIKIKISDINFSPKHKIIYWREIL